MERMALIDGYGQGSIGSHFCFDKKMKMGGG
jgi:hypothetical protein